MRNEDPADIACISLTEDLPKTLARIAHYVWAKESKEEL